MKAEKLIAAMIVVLFVACGSSPVVTDVVPGDIAGDATPDAAGDAGLDAASDVGLDVEIDAAGDDTQSGDADTENADVPGDVPGDLAVDADSDVGGDTTEEFVWSGGCGQTPDVVAWEKISDSTFRRGPFIQMADRDTVTVVWRLAADVVSPGEGCVDYSWDTESRTACGQADRNNQYEIALTGLPAAREITYAARVGDKKTVDLTFRTMPETPRPMKILVYADAHNDTANLAKMADIALAEGVDFGICVGDVASTPNDEEYDQYFDGVRDLASRVNLWAVPGNHDDYKIIKFFESFVLPQGSTDEYDIEEGLAEGYWDRRIGNVWIGGGWVRDFYFVASQDLGEVGFFRQRFLSNDYQTAQWRLFFIHQPAYVAEWPGCDYTGEEGLRTNMIPLVRDAGVQATFHGHMHGIEYGVVDGVNTFIIGGVGGGLDAATDEDPACALQDGWFEPWERLYGHHSFAIVETGCDKLTVRIISVEGETLRTVELPVPVTPAS